MKNRSLFALLLLTLAFTFTALTAAAQTIIVTPSKTTYKRPKPLHPGKRTFTVTRPKIKGTTPAIAKKIETALSFEKNFELNVQEEIKETQWLAEAAYKVDYNKNGILGLSMWIDGSGAYPDQSLKSIVVNIKTGSRIVPADVFSNPDGLAAKLKAMQKKEITAGIATIKKEDPEAENPADLFESADFTAENLDEFAVGDKGITFWYDYGFPHVIQALQPEGRYMMTWAQLKPYIKPAGLFGQFVK